MLSFKQGDIILVEFDEKTCGHEQSGKRPAIVVSNDYFNKMTNMAYVYSISHTKNGFPLHIKLENAKTTGYILCEQLRSIDVNARNAKFLEHASEETINKVLSYFLACIDNAS